MAMFNYQRVYNMIYDSLITTSCWSLTPPGWWTISPGLPTSPRTPSWRHGRAFFLPMEMDRKRALKQRIWRFPEIGVPSVLINVDGIFHYKPSIGGYHHLWKPPYEPRFHQYSINISVYISIYLSMYLSIYLSIFPWYQPFSGLLQPMYGQMMAPRRWYSCIFVFKIPILQPLYLGCWEQSG